MTVAHRGPAMSSPSLEGIQLWANARPLSALSLWELDGIPCEDKGLGWAKVWLQKLRKVEEKTREKLDVMTLPASFALVFVR